MKKIITVFTVFLLWSCGKEMVVPSDGTVFYFDSPQPINDSELNSLPSKFRGKYLIDDVELTITDKEIYHAYLDDGRLAKSALDSLKEIIEYKNNKLILKEDKKVLVYDAKDEKDSIYYYRKRIDTVFRISNSQKAKRINGQLVLSEKDSVFWNVKMLSLEKDILKWKCFSYRTDYDILKPIVKDIRINADSTVIHLKPTRREFGKILGLKTLTDIKYKKIK